MNQRAGVPGDSTRWVIPGERMDYDMAIDGMVQLREAKTLAVSTEV